MFLELYFEQPLLKTTFFFHDRTDYLLLHAHDKNIDVERKNVLYLYRDPVETIFSQLSFYHEDTNDLDRIEYWTDLYGKHLAKWLHQEEFTRRKTVLRYDYLKSNPNYEFGKAIRHFETQVNEVRLSRILTKLTKTTVKKTAFYQPRAVNISKYYEKTREIFKREHVDRVWEILLRDREYLKDDFANEMYNY